MTDRDRHFMTDDDLFHRACALLRLEPSVRQHAKWRRGEGQAWDDRHRAQARRRNEEKRMAKP
jgi:hypothetical protein